DITQMPAVLRQSKHDLTTDTKDGTSDGNDFMSCSQTGATILHDTLGRQLVSRMRSAVIKIQRGRSLIRKKNTLGTLEKYPRSLSHKDTVSPAALPTAPIVKHNK
ncbi:hypothetical protein LSAT2_016340, partial [Lamellibrachia satsuma]